MQKTMIKFLKVLCSLYDGENYVPEHEIRKKWKNCPSHNTILNLGKDTYFEYNLEPSNPGYLPTIQGFTLVSDHKRSNLLLTVSLLTLAASISVPLLQSFLK